MTHFNKKAEKIIRSKIISEHNCIKVKPGKCRFNYQCSYNAVHEAVRKGDKKIAMVVYFVEGYPIIHFINYKKGVYTDNTLGEWSSQYEYYLIRFIGKDDFWNVNYIFDRYRDNLKNCLPFWTRIFNTNTF